jgi:hypothetical protein
MAGIVSAWRLIKSALEPVRRIDRHRVEAPSDWKKELMINITATDQDSGGKNDGFHDLKCWDDCF